MPFSAYVNAGLFVVAAAAALFAAAGTIAVPGFWAGKKLPLSLRIFSLVMFMHWIVAGLDRGRFHWSDDVPGWLLSRNLSRRHDRPSSAIPDTPPGF